MVGPAGAGKTTLVAELAGTSDDWFEQVVWARERDARRAATALENRLAAVAPLDETRASSGRWLLVIDDHSRRSDISSWLADLRRNIVVILIGRRLDPRDFEMASRHRHVSVIELSPSIDEAEARDFVQRALDEADESMIDLALVETEGDVVLLGTLTHIRASWQRGEAPALIRAARGATTADSGEIFWIRMMCGSLLTGSARSHNCPSTTRASSLLRSVVARGGGSGFAASAPSRRWTAPNEPWRSRPLGCRNQRPIAATPRRSPSLPRVRRTCRAPSSSRGPSSS